MFTGYSPVDKPHLPCQNNGNNSPISPYMSYAPVSACAKHNNFVMFLYVCAFYNKFVIFIHMISAPVGMIFKADLLKLFL